MRSTTHCLKIELMKLRGNMTKTNSSIHILLAISLIWIQTQQHVSCNPINFGTTSPPLLPIAPLPLPAPMLIESHYNNPYTSMQQPAQFFLASPFGPMAFDTNRRSLPGIFRQSDKSLQKPSSDPVETDEQKALEGLPLSFIEPEGPSTLTERISDSFSAIGEGVRNHFKSLTENFSDTVDDIKDAWRLSDNSKKRGGVL